ncbi:MAG: ABC transporter permease [Bacteroidales bacterium]
MDAAPDINIFRLMAGFGLLLVPAGLSIVYRLGIVGRLFLAVGRMAGQLFLVSILLIYLFEWDHSLVNIAWVVLMILFASFSAIHNSNLDFRRFFVPVFVAYIAGAGSVLLFFNAVIVNPENIFSAQLLVVVGGMLLGNSLHSIIIGISRYYESIRKEQKRYLYLLSLGATAWEAQRPFFREGILAALNPFLANMATMGVVFLPGMMTGQILGGASPDTAIKYQIAIMLAIFTAVTLSVSLAIYLTSRKSFDGYGVLKEEVFRT